MLSLGYHDKREFVCSEQTLLFVSENKKNARHVFSERFFLVTINARTVERAEYPLGPLRYTAGFFFFTSRLL